MYGVPLRCIRRAGRRRQEFSQKGERMDISKSTLLQIVDQALTREQIEGSLIYWDRRPVHTGELIRAGPRSIAMPFDGTVVFVDLAPQANWAHPCLYLLVKADDLTSQVVEASFPPSWPASPETLIVLLKYGKQPADERDFHVFDG
jgi:hypothetical protein